MLCVPLKGIQQSQRHLTSILVFAFFVPLSFAILDDCQSFLIRSFYWLRFRFTIFAIFTSNEFDDRPEKKNVMPSMRSYQCIYVLIPYVLSSSVSEVYLPQNRMSVCAFFFIQFWNLFLCISVCSFV